MLKFLQMNSITSIGILFPFFQLLRKDLFMLNTLLFFWLGHFDNSEYNFTPFNSKFLNNFLTPSSLIEIKNLSLLKSVTLIVSVVKCKFFVISFVKSTKSKPDKLYNISNF